MGYVTKESRHMGSWSQFKVELFYFFLFVVRCSSGGKGNAQVADKLQRKFWKPLFSPIPFRSLTIYIATQNNIGTILLPDYEIQIICQIKKGSVWIYTKNQTTLRMDSTAENLFKHNTLISL